MSHHKIPKRKIILLFSLLAALVIITSLFIWGVLSGWIRPFAAGGQIQNTASFSYTDSTGQQVLGQSNTVTTQVTSAPTPPSNLAATPNSSTQITLTWTDNSSDETSFKIERSLSATSGFTQISTVASNITAYANSGLSANTTYYYRVRASNSTGDSAYSNVANATTNPAPTDNPPAVTLTAPADGATVSGTVAVTATATDDKGVSRVDFYLDGVVVFSDTASPYSWSWITTSYNNGTHTVMARAYDTIGQYASDTHTVTVNNPTQTVTISKVNVSTTTTTATFSWKTNVPATSQVCYGISRPDEICTPVDQNLVTSHQMTILGLTSRTNYQYEIRSNLGGAGAGSARYTKSFRTKTK